MMRILGWAGWSLTLFSSTVALTLAGTPALAETYFRVGILDKPKTLNPFQAGDAWAKRVLMLIHQPLYLVEPGTQMLIPWLAEDQPAYDPTGKSLTFHLREMRWDDGTEFSAEDVVFTAEVYKKFRIPGEYAYWQFVERIKALDKRTVRITIERPMAVLFTRTLASRIVQKRKWEPVIRKAEQRLSVLIDEQKAKGKTDQEALVAALTEPLRMIQAHLVMRPVGLGPFKLDEWRLEDSYILLVKNDYYFGQGKAIAGRRLGPFIDSVVFKVYDNLGAATVALKRGDIDFLWKGMSHALVRDLTQSPEIKIQTTPDSGYRYLAFNLRKAPMSDAAFRRAVAYLIDKEFIVKRILHDYGQRLDTLVPQGDIFYHNPDTPTYGKGMDAKGRAREAYRILSEAGYRWQKPPVDDQGRMQKGGGLIMPDGSTVPWLTVLTPPADYDTEMAASGQVIQGWLRDFGIPVSWKTTPFASLLHKIRSERDFDMFILGWRGLSDPDYLRRFFHSSYDGPNGRNYTGYRNAEFDKMAELQAKTMDFLARRKIVLDLQSLLMQDLPYVPLYVPFRLEGIRTDRFEGWTTSLGSVGNHWTFCLLRPTKK